MVSPRWFAMSAVLLAVAILGWMRGPRLNRIGLLVVAFNTGLSFLLYRSRNQAVAVCAMGVAAGVGLPIAWSIVERRVTSRVARACLVAVLAGALGTRAAVLQRLVGDRVAWSKLPDACGPDVPNLSRGFMERVWRLYNLELPECAGDGPIQ
jgi:lipoprotein signal peptidase